MEIVAQMPEVGSKIDRPEPEAAKAIGIIVIFVFHLRRGIYISTVPKQVSHDFFFSRLHSTRQRGLFGLIVQFIVYICPAAYKQLHDIHLTGSDRFDEEPAHGCIGGSLHRIR